MAGRQARFFIGNFSGHAGAVSKIFGDRAHNSTVRSALIVPGQIITSDMLNNIQVYQIDSVNYLLTATTSEDINVRLTDGRVVLVRAGTSIMRRNGEGISFNLSNEDDVDILPSASPPGGSPMYGGTRRRSTRRRRRSTRRHR